MDSWKELGFRKEEKDVLIYGAVQTSENPEEIVRVSGVKQEDVCFQNDKYQHNETIREIIRIVQEMYF